MLVLSRRLAETLVIGEDVRITVIEITGNQVKFAIDAPKNVRVDREEIRIRKDSQIKKAD